MIRSMTAFARSSASAGREGGRWVIEIRSLNSRYFEFSLNTPPGLTILESRIRDMVYARIRRGKVTVMVARNAPENKTKSLSLDETVVRFFVKAQRRLHKKYGLKGDLSLSDLIGMPGIFAVNQPSEDPEKVWRGIRSLLKQTIACAVRSKQTEGGQLAADIKGRLAGIEKAVSEIEKRAAGRSRIVFEKLSEKVEGLLADREKDSDRIQREVAFLAERSDITEETVRMRSHLKLFANRLEKDAEIGRELDFRCQEMNREVNTMASKSQLFEISAQTVFVKGELEKIREQVQNIE